MEDGSKEVCIQAKEDTEEKKEEERRSEFSENEKPVEKKRRLYQTDIEQFMLDNTSKSSREN